MSDFVVEISFEEACGNEMSSDKDQIYEPPYTSAHSSGFPLPSDLRYELENSWKDGSAQDHELQAEIAAIRSIDRVIECLSDHEARFDDTDDHLASLETARSSLQSLAAFRSASLIQKRFRHCFTQTAYASWHGRRGSTNIHDDASVGEGGPICSVIFPAISIADLLCQGLDFAKWSTNDVRDMESQKGGDTDRRVALRLTP